MHTWKFLSTLSLRRATDKDHYVDNRTGISIHALLAESDETLVILPKELDDFYPRSPCGERLYPIISLLIIPLFLSTLSLRRATISANNHIRICKNFYPRSPCGERPVQIVIIVMHALISIHALLAESDWANFSGFYWWGISIHALLAESDYRRTVSLTRFFLFLSTLSLRRAPTI